MTSKMKDIMQIEKSNIPLNEPLLQIQSINHFPTICSHTQESYQEKINIILKLNTIKIFIERSQF